MPDSRLKSIVESILFVSDTPLSLDRLATVLDEFERADIRMAVGELLIDYGGPGRGVVLAEVAGGWQFRSHPDNGDYLRRLVRAKIAKFSQSSLETLAIIAYRQPITRAEIEYLRGVDVGGVLKTLLERKLVRILGKKDVPGKPLIYGTSREFLEVFGLKDLASLPTLKEIHELIPPPDQEQQELPLSLEEGAGEGPGQAVKSGEGGKEGGG
jgi:segregation and condensation protein B